ncbi:hypothetical protein PU634_07780 [Oceanimonas pelagia]|uniref:Uncharacterized protein n=1 Tax=Oceanimonas pelagia TaxID=3028314 RepID=A0AA50QBQ0_9GAMM|nr:hypothetical protein [Oceanimonas pelagia]WMC12248.1 hypothetical protein PU634_07780 [Oceanimonas pelagia]
MHKQVLPAIALFSLFSMGAAHADGIDRLEKRLAERRGVQTKEVQIATVSSGQAPARLFLQGEGDGVDRLKKRMEELRKARG